MSIELRHLRYFLAVAETGQFSRAADRLHIAQPALSQAVRQLEREVGAQLLVRHPRGVEVTDAGAAFSVQAHRALTAIEAAAEAARSSRRGRTLSLGFLPPWTDPATRLVNAVSRGSGGIAVRMRELDLHDPLAWIRDGRTDAALIWGAHDAADLHREPVLRDARVVCLAESHPLAARPVLGFEQVADEPIPGVHPSLPRAWIEFWSLADRRGRPAREIDETPQTWEETAALLATGRAVCFDSATRTRALMRPGIVAVPLRDVPPAELSLMWRRASDDPALSVLERAARSLSGELARA